MERLEGRRLLATLLVTNTADAGAGSLRQAILDANGTRVADVIAFAIPGEGVQTIGLVSALPAIRETVTTDGYTQPGARPNTLAVGSDARLLINLGRGSLSMNIYPYGPAGDCVVGGLVVGAVTVTGTNHVAIERSFIGADPIGTARVATGVVRAASGTHGRVGGPDPASRNVIAGGISIYNASLTVTNNYIGTNATGSKAIGKRGDGIRGLTAYGSITRNLTAAMAFSLARE